jgi:hypothetical protein
MNYGKAVEEVWKWRESLAKDLEKITPDKRADYLNKRAADVCKKYGIKSRIVKREHVHA